ncbi:Uncharacterised protein [Edwardsiella hoshinae]|uniref:Nickel/cobalt homeostasis protein RcnB n=2 Tax=Edwardsiella hoshinae TaxID=93378 RepID=A0A376DEU4_9GAMM|nr:anti-virulence regulator CigR family protein [Edwardsiella hoshinae]STC87881.1 Uncharacterised protein [Edwardsiella hoshinae]
MSKVSMAMALVVLLGSGVSLPLSVSAGQGSDKSHGNGHGHGRGNIERYDTWRDLGGGRQPGNSEKGSARNQAGSVDWHDFRRQSRLLGSASYKPLPPGIAKQLAKGKPLPPGIAKQVLPARLARLLPHYPGREWIIVGKDLVSVISGSAIIAEIIRHAFD